MTDASTPTQSINSLYLLCLYVGVIVGCDDTTSSSSMSGDRDMTISSMEADGELGLLDPDLGVEMSVDADVDDTMDQMMPISGDEGVNLGLPDECDLNAAARYENFVLAQDCPGPCCWEFPGDQLREDPKRANWIEPRIHSAYHDLPTQSLKSLIPQPVDDLRFYVPLAKFGITEVLDDLSVACVNDSDCSAVGPALTATCARQDGDGDGQSYESAETTEYLACIDEVICVDSGGHGGDLATQSAVPAREIERLCEDITPPNGGACVEQTSVCVYPPAWVSPPPPDPPSDDFRARPIVRPAGRLFIQGVNLIDTEMDAYFVRVRSADRSGPPTPFTKMSSDPISGDAVIELSNGQRCVFGADAEGDCAVEASRGQVRYAVQPDTWTRGAGAADTTEVPNVVQPMFWYLERERQWLRYHQRMTDGVDVTFGFAELYDDLVILDVPPHLAPGLYALQLGYSVNRWLQSVEEVYGRQSACLVRNQLRDRCVSAFENPRLAEQQCASLLIECDDPEVSVSLERDRKFMTNPIYIQVAPNLVEQTYRINIDGFRAIQSGEYGPGAYGPQNRGDIWVSDDVNFFSMIIRFDPEQLEDDTECFVGSLDERPANPVCAVSGPWVKYLEDVEPGQTYSLADREFAADVNVRPGEVVNVVTFVFDTDDGSGGQELDSILDNTGNILGGVAQIVAGAYGADGIGEGVAGVINGIFSLTGGLISGLEDPELIALTVTSYTAQDLALLTLAAQMGLSSDELLATEISSLADKPLFEMVFQGVDYDITETVQLPETLVWSRHSETRRFEARAPDAREIGCIREELLNSCAYRGQSTYEIDYSIEHLRSLD